MTRRLIVAAAASVALLLPASASAATLSIGTGGVAQYTGAASEANHLVLSYNWFQGTYLFSDTGATAVMVLGSKSPCHAYSAQLAYCPWGSLSSVDVQLGNGGSYAQSQLGMTPVTMRAGTGNDTLIGGGGADTLIAGPGHDTLTAGHGNTTLDGGAGPSTLNGGPGHDTFNGGAGGETINARDGVAEQVTCGAGTDSVVADPTDTVASDCEQVDRGTAAPSGGSDGSTGTGTGGTGGGGYAGTGTTSLPAIPLAQVAATQAVVTQANVLPVKVACPANVPGGCSGTLTITLDLGAAHHKAVAARRRKLIVARHRKFAIAAGTSVSVPVRLDRRAVRIFRRKGRVSRTRRFKATVTLSMRTETGTVNTSRTIVVHAARRRTMPKPPPKHGRR